MSAPRWDEVPEARQLASLGKRLSRAAQTRLQWMLFYYFNRRNVQRTCRHFGISWQTFYRWKRRFDRHDLTTLEQRSHRPCHVRRPTWSADLAEHNGRLGMTEIPFCLSAGHAVVELGSLFRLQSLP